MSSGPRCRWTPARPDSCPASGTSRHPVGAFPVRVLLVAERVIAPSGQEFMCGSVVGRLHDEVCSLFLVIDRLGAPCRHSCRGRSWCRNTGLPTTGLAMLRAWWVRKCMWVSSPRRMPACPLVHPLDVISGPVGDIVVNSNHPRPGQRGRCRCTLLADLAERGSTVGSSLSDALQSITRAVRTWRGTRSFG